MRIPIIRIAIACHSVIAYTNGAYEKALNLLIVIYLLSAAAEFYGLALERMNDKKQPRG